MPHPENQQLDNGTWTERTQCSSIPLAVIIGSTVGSLFFIGICLIVTAVVLVNLKDYYQFKRYEAERAALAAQLEGFINPIYQDKPDCETTVVNPAYGDNKVDPAELLEPINP